MKIFQSLTRVQSLVILIATIVALVFSYLLLSMTALNALRVEASTVLTETSGEWTAKLSNEHPDRIQLMLNRRSSAGGDNMMGESVLLNELQGLSTAEINSEKSAVKFTLAREAGTISFDGLFQKGRGSGTVEFYAE